MNISAHTKTIFIIGDPVHHSLSPAMHNAGYIAQHIEGQFVYLAAQVKVQDVKDVITAMRVMGIHGLTCTVPHKVEVMKYLDEIDPVAQKIGAVNTVVNEHGTLKGYNTDWLGTVIPLEKLCNLKGKRVALLGAGGAARAMAYGVWMKGARVSVFNRTLEKARALAETLSSDISVFPMEAISERISSFDIIINATTLGMGKHVGISPMPKQCISSHHIVFDAVYTPRMTQLLIDAHSQGAKIIGGIEMLLHQGTAQYELYTGKEAPLAVMRQVLLDHSH